MGRMYAPKHRLRRTKDRCSIPNPQTSRRRIPNSNSRQHAIYTKRGEPPIPEEGSRSRDSKKICLTRSVASEAKEKFKESLFDLAEKNSTTPLHVWVNVVCPNSPPELYDDFRTTIFVHFMKGMCQLTVTDLQDVVSRDPEMVNTRDENAMNPLIFALNRKADVTVLKTLASVYNEDSIQASDFNSMTLLHLASHLNCELEVFKVLVDAAGDRAPELARRQTNETRSTALHIQLREGLTGDNVNREYRKDDRVAKLLIDTMLSGVNLEEEDNPLRLMDSEGYTPPHLAAQSSPGESVAQKLVARCPEALELGTARSSVLSGRLLTPLFVAAERYKTTKNDEMIWFFLHEHLEGVRYIDRGFTFLHFDLPPAVVEYVLKNSPEVWPEASQYPGLLATQHPRLLAPSDRTDPCYYTLLYNLRSVILNDTIFKHPDAALEAVNDHRDTILHVAAAAPLQTGPWLHEFVVAVINACPATVQARNIRGWTPLHFEMRVDREDGTLKLLLQTYPEALYTHVSTRWDIPSDGSDEAIPFGRPYVPGRSSILRYLLKRPKRFAPKDESHRYNIAALLQRTLKHGHWVPPLHIVASHSAYDSLANDKTVDFLYERDRKAIIQQVAYIVPHGGYGRLPLHVACAQPGCRPQSIAAFLNWCPDAVDMPDALGLLPLALAQKAGACVETLYVLLREYPSTLHEALLGAAGLNAAR